MIVRKGKGIEILFLVYFVVFSVFFATSTYADDGNDLIIAVSKVIRRLKILTSEVEQNSYDNKSFVAELKGKSEIISSLQLDISVMKRRIDALEVAVREQQLRNASSDKLRRDGESDSNLTGTPSGHTIKANNFKIKRYGSSSRGVVSIL